MEVVWQRLPPPPPRMTLRRVHPTHVTAYTMLTPRSDGGGDARHGNTCAGVHKKGVRHVLLMSSHTPCLTGQLTKNATQKHVGPHAGASMPPPTGVTTNVRVRACVRGSEKNVGVEGYAVSMKPPLAQQHTCSTQAPRGQPSPCGSCLGPYQGGRRLGRRLPVQQRAAQRGVPPHRPSTSQPLPRGCHPHKGPEPQRSGHPLQVTHHTSPASCSRSSKLYTARRITKRTCPSLWSANAVQLEGHDVRVRVGVHAVVHRQLSRQGLLCLWSGWRSAWLRRSRPARSHSQWCRRTRRPESRQVQ